LWQSANTGLHGKWPLKWCMCLLGSTAAGRISSQAPSDYDGLCKKAKSNEHLGTSNTSGEHKVMPE